MNTEKEKTKTEDVQKLTNGVILEEESPQPEVPNAGNSEGESPQPEVPNAGNSEGESSQPEAPNTANPEIETINDIRLQDFTPPSEDFILQKTNLKIEKPINVDLQQNPFIQDELKINTPKAPSDAVTSFGKQEVSINSKGAEVYNLGAIQIKYGQIVNGFIGIKNILNTQTTNILAECTFNKKIPSNISGMSFKFKETIHGEGNSDKLMLENTIGIDMSKQLPNGFNASLFTGARARTNTSFGDNDTTATFGPYLSLGVSKNFNLNKTNVNVGLNCSWYPSYNSKENKFNCQVPGFKITTVVPLPTL